MEISQNPIWANFLNSPVRDETDTSGIYIFYQTVSYITAVGNPKVVPACVPVFSSFTMELHVVICDMVFIIAIFINNITLIAAHCDTTNTGKENCRSDILIQ